MVRQELKENVFERRHKDKRRFNRNNRNISGICCRFKIHCPASFLFKFQEGRTKLRKKEACHEKSYNNKMNQLVAKFLREAVQIKTTKLMDLVFFKWELFNPLII